MYAQTQNGILFRNKKNEICCTAYGCTTLNRLISSEICCTAKANIILYGTVIEKNGNLPFATWIDQESITLNEISQTEKDKYCIISLICGI